MPGSHDQRDFNELNTRELFIGKNYGVFGDSGFFFNRLNDTIPIHGYEPKRKPRNGNLTDEQLEYNTRLSKSRVVVENSIGQLKKWKVLGEKLRLCTRKNKNLEFYNKILRVLVVLTNKNMDMKPLRCNNWEINHQNDI